MEDLANDLLNGAAEIALYVYRRDDAKFRRRVYHKAQTGDWPIWRDGATLMSRRSLSTGTSIRQPPPMPLKSERRPARRLPHLDSV